MSETPLQDKRNLNAKRPFCDLVTFKRVYLDAIARGCEAGLKDLEQCFYVGPDGAHAKIQHHGSHNTEKSEAR